jgi:hypothetical protein
MLEMINKNKIRADDYISILMILSYLGFALFFRIEAFVSIMVYPFASLAIFGILKIINGLNKKKKDNSGNLNKILLGTVYLIFGVLFLNFILIQPNITGNIIITLIAFPMLIVGIAAVVKGYLVDIYLIGSRLINIIIGIITIVISLMAFTVSEEVFVIYFAILLIVLLINILSRAALYLSEFGLSLSHLRNFKLFLYIISDYLLTVDRNGNLILSKIE